MEGEEDKFIDDPPPGTDDIVEIWEEDVPKEDQDSYWACFAAAMAFEQTKKTGDKTIKTQDFLLLQMKEYFVLVPRVQKMQEDAKKESALCKVSLSALPVKKEKKDDEDPEAESI